MTNENGKAQKVRVTVIYEYIPNPEHYEGCTTVEDMKNVDMQSYIENDMSLEDLIPDGPTQVFFDVAPVVPGE